jgi:cytochrome d ubiquinol oxidase subunit II
MIEFWYSVLVLMMIAYVVFDGRNFGVGVLHLFVAKTPAERRQVIDAIGSFFSWHEVWLISFGGTLFLAFPRLYALSFSGYYLALFLILWCLVLRGISVEVGGHMDDRMWRSFWDAVFAFSNLLLATLFGVALGDMARGVPIDANGQFPMAFFTNFGVRGNVGLLDWYTVSVGVMGVVALAAHGATYLAFKTDGPVNVRCGVISRRLWALLPVLFLIISIETWVVRPELIGRMVQNPVAWLGILIFLAGAAAIVTGLKARLELRTFIGSQMVITGLLIAGAATIFPVVLYSTLSPQNSLTIYNTAAGLKGLELALIWWPVAFALTCAYYVFLVRHYAGKIKLGEDASVKFGEPPYA